ncbi:ATP-binding protein [Streptomyces sp. NPDC002889]
MRKASAADENGRGILLLDQLARQWGATPHTTGKTVWFDIELPNRNP